MKESRTNRQKPGKQANKTAIDPDVDWQASVLATKVMRRVLSLADATVELDEWQKEAHSQPKDRAAKPQDGDAHKSKPVDSRSLIVTHMLNAILKRGY